MVKGNFLFFLFILLLFILSFFISCGQAGKQEGKLDTTALVRDSLCNIKYAKGFKVRTLKNGIRLVDVADPQTEEDKMPVSYHFALIPKEVIGYDIEGIGHYTPVQVPVERTIVMTMLQLSNFTALDALDIVRGITGASKRSAWKAISTPSSSCLPSPR